MRWLIGLLIFLLLLLQYKLWVADGGVNQYVRLKHAVARMEQENQTITKRNQSMRHQVNYVKQHPEAMEGYAREDLGMLKEGETYYQVLPPTHSAHAQ